MSRTYETSAAWGNKNQIKIHGKVVAALILKVQSSFENSNQVVKSLQEMNTFVPDNNIYRIARIVDDASMNDIHIF